MFTLHLMWLREPFHRQPQSFFICRNVYTYLSPPIISLPWFLEQHENKAKFRFLFVRKHSKKQKTIGVLPISRIMLKCWNTKWSLRRQLSTTFLSQLCSTWCVDMSLELFEFHNFNIRTWPKEAYNKNEIFLWLEILKKHFHVRVPVLACTRAPVCERVETQKHWIQIDNL